MNDSKNFFSRIKNNTTFRVTSSYAVASFVIIQVISLISEPLNISENIFQTIVWVAIIGFPIAVIVSLIVSSSIGTLKLSFVTIFLITGTYVGWSLYNINFIKTPQLEAAFENDNYAKTWLIARDINKSFPFIPKVKEALDQLSREANIDIKQKEVDVYWKPYGMNDFEWEFIGTDPDKQNLPVGPIQLKLEKEGYKTAIVSNYNPSLIFKNFPVDLGFYPSGYELIEENKIPDGMVYVPGGSFVPAISGEGTESFSLSPYFIDKYEVTNKEYKKFVDSGGYMNPRYWEEMDFILDGNSIQFKEAMSLMIDSTGRNGPANWELSDYPPGEDNFPVTGISWYEAQAYAKFMGNILPPYFHWAKAAYPADEWAAPIAPEMLSKSNYKSNMVSEVGLYDSLGPYGTYDMTGNVREWVWNIFGGRGMTLGGAVSEPEYTGFQANPMPRFDRSELTGFRTVRLLNPADLNPFGDEIQNAEPPPLEFYKPLDEEKLKLYTTQFAYGRANMQVETYYVDDSHEDWIKEKLSIDLGYNNEKMDVLIFRPKNFYGAIPSVIVYPGLNYFMNPPNMDEINPGEYGLDFIIKSGNALVWAAFKGSLNRIIDSSLAQPRTDDQLRQFREMMVDWRVDSGRLIDYLEDRQEFANEKINYLGMSYGAVNLPIVLLTEKRFNSAIFLSGGFNPYAPPHSDGIFYLDQIKLPVLMLNGEQDFLIPIESQEALYQGLGTSAEDKKYVLFKAGHWPLPRNQMINETLEWLDKYN